MQELVKALQEELEANSAAEVQRQIEFLGANVMAGQVLDDETVEEHLGEFMPDKGESGLDG